MRHPRKADVRAAWRLLAGQRDLRLLLSAGLISQAGDWILLVGMLYRVYTITGSAVASALTMASAAAPQVLLGAVAGVFADRWDRKRMMITANLLQAAGLVPLLLVHSAGQVWIVFVVMFTEGVIAQFFGPAQQAMVPRLVPEEQLLTANALSGQVGDVARLTGSGLGGVIAAVGGITAVTLTDAASFIGSAALIALVRASGRTGGRAGGTAGSHRLTVLGDLRAGLRLVTRDRMLRALLIFALVTSVGEGIMAALFTPFVEHVLHGSSEEFGLVVAAQAVGGILGGLVATTLSQRFSPTQLFVYGSIAFGFVDLAIFLYPLGYVAVWPAVAGMILVGVPSALSIAGLMTLFQGGSEDAFRGRMFGAIGTAEGITVLAGTLGAGFLSRSFGIVPVIAIQGASYALAGLAMLVWLTAGPPSVRVQSVAAGNSLPDISMRGLTGSRRRSLCLGLFM
jgi:Na+/melibiose symporter-like transporter